MAWLNFSVMTIWSAMTPAGGMLPTWRRDDDKFVCGARAPCEAHHRIGDHAHDRLPLLRMVDADVIS